MVELSDVLKQLTKVGYRNKFWQRAEVKELCNVLHDDEVILKATNGYYEGGFGLLVATDHRLLLIDHKPMFLTLDSVAYSMIQELSFNYRLFNSTLHIFTSNKCLDFSSWNHDQIRGILSYAQKAMKLKAVKDEPSVEDGKTGVEPKQENLQPQYIPIYVPQQQLTGTQPVDPHQVPLNPVNTYYTNENPQPNLVPSSTNVNNNLANLALSQKDLLPEPRLAAIRTPGLAQRQYFRRYF